MIERIHSQALDLKLDPLVASTDVFVTAVLWVGSKSLSHVLAAIERTKDRLLDSGAASEPARAQVVAAVMDYWQAHPGVAVAIVEKLLNYGILTPAAVVHWALVAHAGRTRGGALARAYVFELAFNTVVKVTGRVRQVATAVAAQEEGARAKEVKAMNELFRTMEDALVAWAAGSKDEMIEAGDEDGEHDRLVRRWGERWLRVFRRRAAIEAAFVAEADRAREKREEEMRVEAQQAEELRLRAEHTEQNGQDVLMGVE